MACRWRCAAAATASPVAPTSAYFDFFTRFWALGCALLLGLNRAPAGATPRVAPALSWLGLALLLGCGFLIGSTLAFPGYASLWPVLAALLLIHYGQPEHRYNASWLLSLPWLAGFGAISFGVYLLHWPLYVAYPNVNLSADVSPAARGLGAAVAVGGLHLRQQEGRLHRPRPVQRARR